MGKLRAGLLGKVTGKIGGIVAQTWKGLNTVREFVIPANPRTPKQIFQRDRMSFTGIFCSLIKNTSIPKFWKQYEKNTTAFSECARTNINRQTEFVDETTPFVPAPDQRLTSRGNLEGIPIPNPTNYDPVLGDLDIEWTTGVVGNGAGTDKVYIEVVDQENLVQLANDTTTRDDGGLALPIGPGRDPTKIIVSVTAYRDLVSGVFNSTSTYKQVTAV